MSASGPGRKDKNKKQTPKKKNPKKNPTNQTNKNNNNKTKKTQIKKKKPKKLAGSLGAAQASPTMGQAVPARAPCRSVQRPASCGAWPAGGAVAGTPLASTLRGDVNRLPLCLRRGDPAVSCQRPAERPRWEWGGGGRGAETGPGPPAVHWDPRDHRLVLISAQHPPVEPWPSPRSERPLCGSRPAGPAVCAEPPRQPPAGGKGGLVPAGLSGCWRALAFVGLVCWDGGHGRRFSCPPPHLSGRRMNWTLGAALEAFPRPWRGPPVLLWPCPSQPRPARPGFSRGSPRLVQPGYARGCGRSPRGPRVGRGVPCHRSPEPQRGAGMVRDWALAMCPAQTALSREVADTSGHLPHELRCCGLPRAVPQLSLQRDAAACSWGSS